MIDRDAIYQALHDRLAEELAGDVVYTTRRLEHFEQTESQPAMLVLAGPQRADHQQGLPPVWTLEAEVYLYVRPSSDETPEKALHNLVDRVEASLARDWTDPSGPWGAALAGVESIKLTTVDIEQGLDIGQGVAVIKLEMVATPS